MARNVVITGAGEVGRAIADGFLERGDNVHVCDVLAESVEAATGVHERLRASVADVGSDEDVKRLFDEVGEWMPSVDVLVNGVGIGGPRAATEDTDPDDWGKVLNVNLVGMVRCIRHVAPGMKASAGGSIVNFSSCSSQTAPPNRSVYVASKAAVDGLTRTIARELGPHGVTCNAILPGAIANERLAQIVETKAAARGQAPDEYLEEALRYVSLRRMVEVREIADYVVFLCSDQARAITGQLLRIDGNFEWED
ncbi:MAG: SDR family oxidoreductase [Thermoleophilaceae bacterium]